MFVRYDTELQVNRVIYLKRKEAFSKLFQFSGFLEAQILKCAKILDEHNEYVPHISMAGEFIQESQMLKSIAMSNFGNGPYIKSITMARSPITAAFKGNYLKKLAEEDNLPSNPLRREWLLSIIWIYHESCHVSRFFLVLFE
ncbi:hypothetical protein AKJ41_05445 [candidate division MSBL1 archaeon SCGC-AAA259O05]|uniref:Uncharacterized protein n=2 Tax=candidate division MSBL1 TaxID=215777 RepID=A0A133UZ28_9EURY|nr:hypothetical protein AKJ57_06470 [candidate division MSBL1 archaeon SCGC-AAA259A05]KXA99430.1 hypothetical protein AKJ41_05445 [candidate division MSBL1 archaeon SCGC-AAA259O05]